MENKKIIEPGTPEFQSLLKKFHKKIGDELDEKVKKGIHEPGHGASHMEMALYIFILLGKDLGLTKEQIHVGALATIMHDLWRENIYSSHTRESAETAKMVLDDMNSIDEDVELSQYVKDLVVKLIALHSYRSSRAKDSRIPEEWEFVLLTIRSADLLSSSGTFGYFRSFSYSGHVLKSMLAQIKVIIKNPKKG